MNSAPRAHTESSQASVDCFENEVGVASHRAVTEMLFWKEHDSDFGPMTPAFASLYNLPGAG